MWDIPSAPQTGRWLIATAAMAGVTLVSLTTGPTAQATTFNFAFTGTCSEACGATAAITPGTGQLTVVLADTQANPFSPGDLLSGIEILPSGAVGSPTLSSQAGSLINLTSNGPGTAQTGNPTHWGVGLSSGQIQLETAGGSANGGAPINMIIGPPDANGNYSNANTGVANGHFSPYINGTATFVILDSSIGNGTLITSVAFNFGTTPDYTKAGTAVGATRVPEPSSLGLLAASLLGIGFFARRRGQV